MSISRIRFVDPINAFQEAIHPHPSLRERVVELFSSIVKNSLHDNVCKSSRLAAQYVAKGRLAQLLGVRRAGALAGGAVGLGVTALYFIPVFFILFSAVVMSLKKIHDEEPWLDLLSSNPLSFLSIKERPTYTLVFIGVFSFFFAVTALDYADFGGRVAVDEASKEPEIRSPEIEALGLKAFCSAILNNYLNQVENRQETLETFQWGMAESALVFPRSMIEQIIQSSEELTNENTPQFLYPKLRRINELKSAFRKECGGDISLISNANDWMPSNIKGVRKQMTDLSYSIQMDDWRSYLPVMMEVALEESNSRV